MTSSRAKELAFEKVHGLWVAIPTPFTDDGRMDEEALAGAVEYYIEGLGVDGIYCGGVMGEFWSLTLAERRRCHEITVDTAAGRVPIIAHTGHHVFAEAVELCRHAEEIGVDFAIVMNPYYPPKPSEELVRHWYRSLVAQTSVPLFLFNTSYSGYAISPELIAELAELDTICGIKNPKPREHILRVQELAGDKIVVCDADEEDWLDLHVNHGFPALMSTPALALFQTPDRRPIADYTALADAGDLDGAWRLHATLEGERKAFARWIHGPWMANQAGAVPIAYLKAWLGLMGLPQGPVRPPLVPLTDEEQRDLRTDLDALGLLGKVSVPG